MSDIYNPTNNSTKERSVLSDTSRTTNTAHQSHGLDNHLKNVFVFIKHKIEKLSTAVYMISSYMPHEEPVRSSLRILALSSVGHSAHLTHRQVITHFSDLEKDIEHILALLRLSRTLDMITSMNANILETEYEKVLSILQKQKDKKRTELTPLGITFEAYTEEALRSENLKLENIGQEGGSAALLQKVISPIIQSLPTIDTQQYVSQNKTIAARALVAPSAPKQKRLVPLVENKERRSVRQEQVLKVLKSDEEMSIKDIAVRVRGCSEKTIQRELSQLLEQKKIMRLGDKRWSRYVKLSL